MMLSTRLPRVCLRCDAVTRQSQFARRPTDFKIATATQWHAIRAYTSRTTVPIPQLPRAQRSWTSIRYRSSSGAFEPLRPIPPSSLPTAAPAKQYRRTRKWMRRLVRLGALLGIGWVGDNYFFDSVLTRSVRTFSLGLLASLDYKINFRAHPWTGGTIADLHARNAERLFDLLRTNGGLYLKIGQAIAMQSAVLPPEFQRMFSRMFDDAPQNSWEDVARVIREEFNVKDPSEVFGDNIEHRARASASVAQVHWARLPDGREVAIKVQKREIARQVGWDLWALKVVTRVWTWWFDLPFYNMVPYITERLMLETDFKNEARNSEAMAEYIAAEPRLRGRVYIPRVFDDLTTKRIMTAEWIEGVRLWDREGITKHWEGGWRTGSPGCRGTPLDPPRSSSSTSPPPPQEPGLLKPARTHWKGADGKGGLGLQLSSVMQTLVDLFSAQMFLWGFVHCDPHPGNVLVRRQPGGQAEIVLLDHGLYITMRPAFRLQYARFWKALLAFDNETLKEISTSWGIAAPDIFASATLMRPYQGGDRSFEKGLSKPLTGKEERERAYEMQMRMRKGVKSLLADEDKWPKELIFLGRNLRIVQGNNQYMGSPVNRIKITGTWASRALTESRELSLSARWQNWLRHLTFRVVLLVTDLAFYWTKARQALGLGGGMEDELEDQMKGMAKEFGVELNHSVFEG